MTLYITCEVLLVILDLIYPDATKKTGDPLEQLPFVEIRANMSTDAFCRWCFCLQATQIFYFKLFLFLL